jgi:hypothetical protein
MATTKRILKNTGLDAVVKVDGTAAAETIDLDVDLLHTSQVLDGATQTVTITGLTWTGAANGIITITRGSATIATLQANAAGYLHFTGQDMVPDNVNATSDIVVTISGAQAECWLRLKKISGYKTKFEPEQFGSHDDPTKAGE